MCLGKLCLDISKKNRNSTKMGLTSYFSYSKEYTVPFFLKSNRLPLPSLFVRDCSYYDINWQTAPVSILNQFVKTSQIHNCRGRSVSSDSSSYFFVKKYLLVGASSMLWTGQWISQWVRDVCMSHQSDQIYYKQPIKFLVLKVNGIIQFRTAIFILLWKRRKYLFPHFLWVMLRILVMDEMSLEV